MERLSWAPGLTSRAGRGSLVSAERSDSHPTRSPAVVCTGTAVRSLGRRSLGVLLWPFLLVALSPETALGQNTRCSSYLCASLSSPNAPGYPLWIKEGTISVLRILAEADWNSSHPS